MGAERERDPGEERRGRREPWPIALALVLAAMVSVSLAFYAVAASHPDPPVREASP